jgi:membrane protease YdiL (CAAX protease family)
MKKTSIRRDMFLFLKGPDYFGFNDLSIKEKIIILIKVLILTFIALFLVNLPVLLLKKLNVISEIPMKTDLMLNSIQANYINYKPYFIFSAIFFVPLIEEMSFRLFQTRFRVNYFIISVSLILGVFIEYFLKNILWIPKSYLLLSVGGLIYVLIISALIGSMLFLFRTKIIRIEEFWNKNTGLIIYTVAILFAIGHILNLKFENRDLVFMPLILLPFLVWGLSFGYLRVRIGIIYSIALHFIYLSLRFGLPELSIFLKAYTHQ